MRKTNTFFVPQGTNSSSTPLYGHRPTTRCHNHGLIVDIYPVQMMTIMGFNHGMHVPVVSVLGTLSNYEDDDDDDNDDNDNAKKKMGL